MNRIVTFGEIMCRLASLGNLSMRQTVSLWRRPVWRIRLSAISISRLEKTWRNLWGELAQDA